MLEQVGAEVERRPDGLSVTMPQLVGGRAMTFDIALGGAGLGRAGSG